MSSSSSYYLEVYSDNRRNNIRKSYLTSSIDKILSPLMTTLKRLETHYFLSVNKAFLWNEILDQK